MSDQPHSFEKFSQRYDEGSIPWDDPLPPPEIIDLVANEMPGNALDLGCGFGRTAIYMARHGWTIDGIDFIPQAIEEAKRRANSEGVEGRTTFYVASATDLSFLDCLYDLIIDIGCMHSFTENMLFAYRDEISRLLIPEGRYVLFAHLREENAGTGEDADRWIPAPIVYDLFKEKFKLERVELGTTQVEDKPPWQSGWFWFRRKVEP